MLHASTIWKLVKDNKLIIKPDIEEKALRGSTLDLRLTKNPEEIRILEGEVELEKLKTIKFESIGRNANVENGWVSIPSKTSVLARSLEEFSSKGERLFCLVIPRFYALRNGIIVQGYLEIGSEPSKAEFLIYNSKESEFRIKLGDYSIAQLIFFKVKAEV